MPTYHLAVYECDTEGCGNTVVANDMVVARTEAAEQGWQVRGAIQCKDHRLYSPCVECERPMRPWSTTKELHPGTVARGNKGMCTTCTDNIRRSVGSAVQLDKAVERYLSIRTAPFQNLWQTDYEQRAGAARALAPEDLWEVLGI